MTTIVLPIDFGEKTQHLVHHAIDFAKKVSGKIHLIHIASPDIGVVHCGIDYKYFPDIKENEIKKELRELNEIEKTIKSHNIKCEHLLKLGDSKDIILKYAQSIDADFIVIGSHGRSGIYDLFLGSLTKELTKDSEIPVLVIPCS